MCRCLGTQFVGSPGDITIYNHHVRLLSPEPFLVGFSTTNFTRVWEPTLLWNVGVEKVTSISRLRFSRSMLEESELAHALVDSHRRRPANHDGATRPLRSSVLLLSPGRSGPRKPSAAADREVHPF